MTGDRGLKSIRGRGRNQRSTIMIQMMLNIGGNDFAQSASSMHGAGLIRKMMGLAVVGSGFAVLTVHGVQRLLGG
jgi:hypothetical protein